MPLKPATPVAAAKKSTNFGMQDSGSKIQEAGIRRNMRVSDILTLLPDSAPLIAQYGLSCFSCASNDKETLEDGCRSHGMPEAEIDDLVTDLNEMLRDKPARPQTLMLTEPAAIALKEIMQAEDKVGWGLCVGLDSGGGFCMEFKKNASADEKAFGDDVKLFASDLTLAGIGGATIDFRDGRFKLDLPEDSKKKSCTCKNGGTCDCASKGGCGCGGASCAKVTEAGAGCGCK